jgi:hypothetical protein
MSDHPALSSLARLHWQFSPDRSHGRGFFLGSTFYKERTMSTQQPEALRLADELDGTVKTGYWEAAAELRRLHSVNADLLTALKNYVDGCSLEVNAAEVARAAIAKATGEHHEHG